MDGLNIESEIEPLSWQQLFNAQSASVQEPLARDLLQLASRNDECCLQNIGYTKPEGGMFIHMARQEGDSSLELLDLTLQANVAFVPERVFYDDGSGDHARRLSYSGSDAEWMEEGVTHQAGAIRKLGY